MSDHPENGDEAFEKFINNDSGSCPNIHFIILALREKIKFVSNTYNTSLGAYLKLNEGDPLKEVLLKHITKLMEYSLQSVNQFDFVLMDDTGNEEGGEGNEEEGDPSQI